MALNKKPAVFWSRSHFVLRFLGLTGLFVAAFALVLLLIESAESAAPWSYFAAKVATLRHLAQMGAPQTYTETVLALLVLGLAFGLLTIIIEVMLILRLTAGRRSAFAFNAFVQVGLAVLLVVGVNAYAARHYLRFDLTRTQQFTLPAELQNELRKLNGPTTIIVYLPHQSFGQRSRSLEPETARYVYAAERKVIDKLNDMVNQFREFGSGSAFKVVVLDVEDERFQNKLEAATQDNAPLRDAIKKAPENTIFFSAQGNVQRLSFADLFLLDKEAAPKENDGQGNLVLLDQGIEPLARKVLAVNEKKPIIGLLTIHELLTTEGDPEYPYTSAGLKKALTARGFEVKDVILKKWTGFGPPEPAVYTPDDSKLDDLDERLAIFDNNTRVLSAAVAERAKILQQWRTATLDELSKEYGAELGVQRVTTAIRTDIVADLESELASLQKSLANQQQRRGEVSGDRNKLNLDSLAEQRRMSDLQAKLTRTLADCDLLIIPRMTLRNVVSRDANIPAWLHRLDETQTTVLRDYLKQGKPILACFGSSSDSGDRPPPTGADPDGLEAMFAQLGITLTPQTVLFDTESEGFASSRSSPFGGRVETDVPAAEFDWKPGAGRPQKLAHTEPRPPHPIRQSMRLVARSLGQDAQGKSLLNDLKLRHPQPVYYNPPAGTRAAYDAEFMMTTDASWNEDKPFPTRERTPRYDPPKSDPKKGTLEEKRRGPFPIAVAISTELPKAWYTEKGVTPATARLAVIGHGGVFSGAELSPAREMLLLNTVNWLLGRDQELPRKEEVWKYPRIEMTASERSIWQWGTVLGLPMLFAYLGLVVTLVRRVR